MLTFTWDFFFKGHPEAIGNYHQLVNSGIDFASLLAEGHEEEKTTSPSRQPSTKSVKKNGFIPTGKFMQEAEKCKYSDFLCDLDLVFFCSLCKNSLNNFFLVIHIVLLSWRKLSEAYLLKVSRNCGESFLFLDHVQKCK